MTDINEVINTINDLIARDVFTQVTIAKEMGVADATLSAFRNGKYTGDNERLAGKVRDWYDNYQQQVTLPEVPQFVVTETVQELQELFQSARLMRCINVVVGEPGVGKTAAARDYCSKSKRRSRISGLKGSTSAGTGTRRPQTFTPARLRWQKPRAWMY